MIADYQRFLSIERFANLDGLRFLSIVAVLWHHSGVHVSAPIASRGQMGVHLFFAISGFLITSLMIRERRRNGEISLTGFYKRRALRIFPLYYAVLLVYVVVVLALESGPDAEKFFANLPYFATYTSNWFVEADGRVIFFFAWSLAVEEQFYLTWPWVERYMGRIAKIVLLAAVIGLVAANHFGLLPLSHESLAYIVVWQIAPAIVLGVLAAHLLHDPRGHAAARTVLGHRWSAPAALLLAVLVLSLPTGSMLIEYAAYASLVALVVACTIREDNYLAPMLQWAPIVRIGIVSYGIYLMHMLTFNAVHRAIANEWLAFGVGVLVVWGLAELSFATFERFFLRLKNRLAARTPLPAVGASSAEMTS